MSIVLDRLVKQNDEICAGDQSPQKLRRGDN